MRITIYLFFLSTFFIQPLQGQMLIGPDTLVGNEWIKYGRTYYKFSLAEDGIYRISGSAIQASGISLSAVQGAAIRIYAMGRQVPVFVSTDNTFGTSDFIEFYGHKNRGEMDRYLFLQPDLDMLNPEHSMYTDQSFYYMSFDGEGDAFRVNQWPNNLTSPPPASAYYIYSQTQLFTTSPFDPYFPLSDGGAVSYSSYMHGEGFSKGSETSATVNVSASDRSNVGPEATLHIRMTSANYGSHSFPITWNDQPLGTLHPKDIQIEDVSFTIPLDQLQDINQLKFLSDVPISRMAIASITLTYPRLSTTSAANDLVFIQPPSPSDTYYVFDGFSHGDEAPVIYTTDGLQRMVADFDPQNHVHFVWPHSDQEIILHFADPLSGIHAITSLEQKVFSDWSGDDTEYIIITHPDLMALGTESEYVQYRSSAAGGLYKAKAYSILDIYDQFGYGIDKHPQAVRNFVEFAHRHWPSTKMIFLIGRGIEYWRSRYEDGTWESSFYVPTFGRPGSDQLLTATVWNLTPRYPIARLAVTDANTIHAYLNKVKEHDAAVDADQTLEAKAWIKHVMHISGGDDAGQQQDFKQVMASLGQKLATSDFGAKIYSFQKTSSEFVEESQSKQIEKLLTEGTSLINYLGHSSTSTFEFNINDPTQWSNKGRYPIFSAMGCSAGQIHGTILSLSDRYVLIPEEGAIAFISGSGSQFATALVTWANPWYDYFGSMAYGAPLGESILHGLQIVGNLVNPYLNDSNPARHLLEQQTTQGDPAIKINPLPGPDYLVDRNSVSISPSLLNTKQDSFNLKFRIVNIGRNLRQNLTYTVAIKSSDGTITDLVNSSVLVDRSDVALDLQLPLSINNKPGVYRLLITLDEENLLEEFPRPAAEQNNRLEDNLGVEGIALVVVDNVVSASYPLDFAIVNKAPVELIATSSNSFVHPMNIVLEVDTNGLFNSPFLIHRSFPDHLGTLKWMTDTPLIDGQEYFWRVSADSISPEQGFRWSRHSFTYLPDKSNGWSQSHFHQLTDDTVHQLVPDSIHHTFHFGRKVKNFRMLNRFHDIPAGLVPYFFEDGRFIAKLAQTFRFSDIEGFVVAIDSVTGDYLWNPPGGLYGSLGLPIPMEGFAYNLTTPEGRQNMIHLIENVIPDGYYVFFYTYQHTGFEDYLPETWAADEAEFGKSIFSVIEHQYPGSMIRTLEEKGSLPYIVLFQKNVGAIEEQIAADLEDVISISIDAGSFHTSGTYVSVPVGPASQWGTIEQAFTTFNDTTGQVSLSAWALSPNQMDTLWISHQFTDSTLDISSVDAVLYPWIQLKLETLDSATFRPALIDYWRVLFEGLPEFIIHVDGGFVFNDDTLYQGQTMSLLATVENISGYDVDSLPVSLNILGENSQTEELLTTVSAFAKQSSRQVYFERNTADLLGQYQVVMEVNPDQNIPENIFSNNIGLLSMLVLRDEANPILEVTFDGVHISNGDLVAARPLIQIALHDESPYLRLQDTSLFDIYLRFPSDTKLKRVPFTRDWVTFLAAPATGKNLARVELRPDLFEDGDYQLEVMAKDASGNLAGDNDYLITFHVTHEQSISHIYNFPNPFRSSTRFGYTLTGEGSPYYYKIQILSLLGIVVREIQQDELGPLVVGTHLTDYAWDGTDGNGNPLASGTYIYRMIAKNQNLEEYPRYQTPGDFLFKNGWGKLIIIR